MFQADQSDKITCDRDTAFSISLDPHGPWESFGTLLPVSVVPKLIKKKNFALEVLIKNGRKHTILRPLAVVFNDTNISIEVSTYPTWNLHNSSTQSSSTSETEEIFENQYYHPYKGWVSELDSSKNNDIKHWSNRDFSISSKVTSNLSKH